jgi:FkbM family methyltransferase
LKAVARGYIAHVRHGLTRATWLRVYGLAGRVTPLVAVDANGSRFLLPTGDRPMGKFFAKRNRKEFHTLARALASDADIARTAFLDVGAHIGTSALSALHAGFGRAIACEADPENARLLRANVALNGAEKRVQVVQAAITNRPGMSRVDRGKGGSHKRRVIGPKDTPKGQVVEVPATTLDALLADLDVAPSSIGLLWLDVEGHEWHVLTGALSLLDVGTPVVLEISPRLLARAGTITDLPELLAARYTHALDLGDPSARFLPIAELSALVERCTPRRFTDVLAVRR